MTKQTFNFGKWYTIVWLTVGTLSNLSDYLSYMDGTSGWAVLIAVPTLIWLFNLKLATEVKEEIEISVKS